MQQDRKVTRSIPTDTNAARRYKSVWELGRAKSRDLGTDNGRQFLIAEWHMRR